MSNALTVKDLCKTYIVNKHQNNVLKNVSFTVEEGEMIAIMGPSGSGKSTLLYCVSGMDRITSGQVEFFSKDISKLSQNKMSDIRLKEMGFVFQQMHMMKNLTIFDNIILPAFQAKLHDRKAICEKGEELMRKLSIAEVADNDITEVSGGQLQRACICRSLINEPKMIFADEPTGSLNRKASDDVMDKLNEINKDGVTIMLVTHDIKVAAKCTRTMYIVDGNIKGEYNLGKFSGSPMDLRERERVINNWLLDMGW